MKILIFFLSIIVSSPLWAQSIGIISTSIGPVQWFSGEQSLTLQRGDEVGEGYRVTTGSNARLVLRMNEGSVITLGADTTLELSGWRYQEGGQNNAGRLTLVEGVFRFVTGLITRQPDPQLSVATPSGTIGIRGTDFWGGYLDAGQLDVILLDGEHRLEISNAYGTVWIETPGLGVSVKAGQKPGEPKQWGQEKLQRAVRSVALDQAG